MRRPPQRQPQPPQAPPRRQPEPPTYPEPEYPEYPGYPDPDYAPQQPGYREYPEYPEPEYPELPEGPYGDQYDELPLESFDQPQRPQRPARERREPAPPPDQLDRGPELPHVPGLAGLRALALVAVLVFSQGFDLGRGGFLGISTAFTLSGFLLATLALAEWSQNSRLRFGRFWERRARKIVPPVYVTVLVVMVLQLVVRVGSLPTFRGDVLSAVTFTTNWRLAYPAEGFAQSFSDLSALRHLWPVAITAQIFAVFPLLFVVLMWITRRQWRYAGAAFGAIALASFGAAWVFSGDADSREYVYYSTHTRIGEMLVGVVLGYAVLSPAFRRLLSKPRAIPLVRYGALGAMVALGLLWTFVSYESTWLFHGVTLLNAVLTAWIILATTLPGPAASILGVWPLRKLGEISFSAYLLHWPIYLLLDEDRLPLDGVPLFGIRVAATLGAAFGLYLAVEQLFRTGVRLPRLQLTGAFAGTAVVLVGLAFVLPVNPPEDISLTIDDGEFPGDLDVVAPGGDAAARVLVVGDEFAGSLMSGFEDWNSTHSDEAIQVDTHVASSCPLGGPGELISLGQPVETTPECESWRLRLPDMLDAADYDAVVMLMGAADAGERRLGRDWRHLGDAEYDRWMADQIQGTADVLAEAGVPVLWATTPHVRLDDDASDTRWSDFSDNDPQRIDRLNELIVANVGDRDAFTIVELQAWLYDVPRGEFNSTLREASTFTEEGATSAVEWLVPQILSAK